MPGERKGSERDMGRFVNPDNSAFQIIVNSEIYVDKTELLTYTNRAMNTDRAMICNSRPRRFGKSITANMLTAYYSRGCDSEKIFETYAIGKSKDFKRHLNQYDVIHLDIQWCMMDAGRAELTVNYMNRQVIKELRELYPQIDLTETETIYGALSCINAALGKKFIVIIDEWDVLIRDEAANQSVQDEYIQFLRGMFKGSEPSRFIQLAYLTGILPMKKLKTQSALNNFDEFTMLDAKNFAPYIGFTEEEVKLLCRKYGRDFEEVKRWYDGYLLGNYHVYNPKAVVSVMTWGDFQSYWSNTGTYESILPLINMNFDGLKTDIIMMMSGEGVKVKTKSYQNDMITFKNKDDVLTALIHLGYLAYDRNEKLAYIPNEEIRSEFTEAVEENQWNEFIEFEQESRKLLEATWELNSKEVAERIEKIHMEYTSAIRYHDENSLSSILAIAYLGAMQYYFKPVREFPMGKGFADFVFVPKREYVNQCPALLIELKWDQQAETAIRQMKERKYPSTLEHYTGQILLVGINYDRKTKQHQCRIEKYEN